jgi:hypothetical protein
MARYPRRLHHEQPFWIDPAGAIYHIRIRAATDNPVPLIHERLGRLLMDSVVEYTRRQIWWPTLFLLMPDHIHALLSFHPQRRMSRVVGDWKKWNRQRCGVLWQENFFDHRIRHNESLEEKVAYIRRNPAVKGLCQGSEDWPWVVDAASVLKLLGT